MGSMTGAPKKRVMELIEKYEKTKRGLFSGTVGYINPEGDFDFNVVIRRFFTINQINIYPCRQDQPLLLKAILKRNMKNVC